MRWDALALCLVFATAGQAQTCGNADVAVGGIAGFTDLAIPANTAALRACHARLYLHRVAWDRTPSIKRQEILAVFKDARNPVVEIEMHADPVDYFHGYFATQFLVSGAVPREAEVNYFDIRHSLAEWTRFVDAGRAAGLSVLAPIFSPNSGEFHNGDFASPAWDKLRAAAIYGGGLTLDLPSDFFSTQDPDYRWFAIDEIRWTKARRLTSTVIISPGSSGSNFLAKTKALIATLVATDAQPTQYVVENYEPSPLPGYQNPVGNEHTDSDVAAIALWLARTK